MASGQRWTCTTGERHGNMNKDAGNNLWRWSSLSPLLATGDVSSESKANFIKRWGMGCIRLWVEPILYHYRLHQCFSARGKDDQYIVLQALIPKRGTMLSEIKWCTHHSTTETTEGWKGSSSKHCSWTGNRNESPYFLESAFSISSFCHCPARWLTLQSRLLGWSSENMTLSPLSSCSLLDIYRGSRGGYWSAGQWRSLNPETGLKTSHGDSQSRNHGKVGVQHLLQANYGLLLLWCLQHGWVHCSKSPPSWLLSATTYSPCAPRHGALCSANTTDTKKDNTYENLAMSWNGICRWGHFVQWTLWIALGSWSMIYATSHGPSCRHEGKAFPTLQCCSIYLTLNFKPLFPF